MTWSDVPGHTTHTAAEREAWERGATTLFPAGKLADRVTTVLLLVAGAVLTAVAAVVGIIAVASATASCGPDGGCTPGASIGSVALGVGGAFVVGVLTLVFDVRAWLRRRTSWWIAAVGFVLAVGVVTWGTVLFVQAADQRGDTVGTTASAPAGAGPGSALTGS
jgi:uncharacterized membrane protein